MSHLDRLTNSAPPPPTPQPVAVEGRIFDLVKRIDVTHAAIAAAQEEAEAGRRAADRVRRAHRQATSDPRVRVRARIQADIARAAAIRRRKSALVQSVFYVNFVMLASLMVFIGGEPMGSVGDVLVTVARAAAMLGTYLLLVQLLLVSRLPWLDQLYGRAGLARRHKTNGHAAFTLIVVHVVLVIIGRALINVTGVGAMAVAVIQLRFMWAAIAGLALIVASIVTSIRVARRRLKHDRWHAIHLWSYVGVLLAFAHELYGPDFAGHVWAQSYLWCIYGITFGAIAYARVAEPIYRTLKHQLRVVEIVRESNDTVSIYIEGHQLPALNAQPGQYFHWRFLTREDWRESHPYSLSAAPNSTYLRITVRNAGEASERVGRIRPGTWIAIEGPHGDLTAEHRTKVQTVLIAGGGGITTARSLLEGLPTAKGDMTLIYRATLWSDLLFLDELKAFAKTKGVRVRLVLGSRSQFPASRQPLSPDHLIQIVPNVWDCDVFLFGAPAMTDFVRSSLKTLGVPTGQVHCEQHSI